MVIQKIIILCFLTKCKIIFYHFRIPDFDSNVKYFDNNHSENNFSNNNSIINRITPNRISNNVISFPINNNNMNNFNNYQHQPNYQMTQTNSQTPIRSIHDK